MPSTKVLLQTRVPRTIGRQLDALARARGCSRSAYLERLVRTHVRAVNPRLLRTLDQCPDPRSP